MPYLGDIAEDSVLYFTWDTNDGDGDSITRATDGTISVYKDDGDTQSTAGITDTEDFDSLTGVHMCKIDTSADAFYATGHDYSVVLSAATIDGQTVNATLAHFSIQNRYMRGTDSAGVNAACDTALTDYDPPTKAELDTAVELIQGPDYEDITQVILDVGNVKDVVDAILADTGTDGVCLADDAITAGKYDESTAFPVKSADTGATQIARVGADGDTLEDLSDQIDGLVTQATFLVNVAEGDKVVAAGDPYTLTVKEKDTENVLVGPQSLYTVGGDPVTAVTDIVGMELGTPL